MISLCFRRPPHFASEGGFVAREVTAATAAQESNPGGGCNAAADTDIVPVSKGLLLSTIRRSVSLTKILPFLKVHA